MASDPTLRRLQQLRRDRQAQSESELTYVIYMSVLLLLIVGVPIIRMAVLGLATPDVMALVASPTAPAVLSAITGLLFAGLVVVGRARGPAVMDLFRSNVVASNHLPRRHTLRRPFLISASQLVVALTAVALVLASALAVAGAATALSVIAFVAATVLIGILASIAWLLGQSVSTPTSQQVAAALAVASLGMAAIPGGLAATPWGWFALLYPGAALPAWPAFVALVVMAIIAALAIPRLLDSIRGPELRAQAQRWSSAATFSATADLAGAFAEFRSLPTAGRRWRAVRNVPMPVLMFVRDLVGSLRSPERPIVAALSLLVSGFVLASMSAVPATVAWAPALLGGIIAFLALGVWSDGFRHAADTAVAVPLYGFGVAKEFALHALLPVAGVFVFVGSGALAATATGASLLSVALAVVFALFVITVRMMNATKGQMPIELLAPIPTAAGDLSGVLIVLWQADAVLLVSVASIVLASSWLSAPLLFAMLPIASTIVLWLASRNIAAAR
ncbi:hypothetical protein I6E68_10140 [Salinibacterium sp. NSLL150]|uniref:hypothetical protein n=1 Tax=unclassified Salinibacterium TaxID=2632331 RepID=UPI0018CEA290|nr:MULTISPECIES: hypothetical protein [unclassified Salinibacterium]MBH0099496.1 hypothetical protein [Salinibacterium sp. NSLL35]MBH0102250.1 hypothetical protein [Salinibacterium sp. NSLL150]MBH0105010.1 hypothetical protein [Salinibacterium sp. NSLL16]MBH0107770.1 hypothetical protein [Salinibacterium sp. NSLL17]MBH0110523.1 hypothetical protein [Salinibacterium sp. NG22]